jgi:nucleoside-diphosphate-sugar epimerase
MTRVLVTGAAGFIGSHLCEAFVAAGAEVLALDDLSAGSRDNLEALRGERRFELVVGDVLEAPLVDRLASTCDSVVHLAATVGVMQVLRHPLSAIRTIVNGTDIVLAAAHRHRHTRVVVVSSSEVYGKNPARSTEDTDMIAGPATVTRWAYGAGKRVDEFLALAYWQQHQLPVVLPRLFNTVGPRQSAAYGMVLPRLVGQALRGEQLTVFGDGSQSRCFLHVSDAVRAILGLHEHPDAVGRPFNVGSPEQVTIGELAQRVLRITGSTSTIRLVPYRDAYGDNYEEVPHRYPDTTQIQQLLGWHPAYSLDDTIAATVAAHRAHPVPA